MRLLGPLRLRWHHEVLRYLEVAECRFIRAQRAMDLPPTPLVVVPHKAQFLELRQTRRAALHVGALRPDVVDAAAEPQPPHIGGPRRVIVVESSVDAIEGRGE